MMKCVFLNLKHVFSNKKTRKNRENPRNSSSGEPPDTVISRRMLGLFKQIVYKQFKKVSAICGIFNPSRHS